MTTDQQPVQDNTALTYAECQSRDSRHHRNDPLNLGWPIIWEVETHRRSYPAMCPSYTTESISLRVGRADEEVS